MSLVLNLLKSNQINRTMQHSATEMFDSLINYVIDKIVITSIIIDLYSTYNDCNVQKEERIEYSKQFET